TAILAAGQQAVPLRVGRLGVVGRASRTDTGGPAPDAGPATGAVANAADPGGYRPRAGGEGILGPAAELRPVLPPARAGRRRGPTAVRPGVAAGIRHPGLPPAPGRRER